uniref:BEL1-like homeodomain protein 1 n=1 Tax=Anthurium amnicola TaxID=1678845 RepID=A0A1D1YUH1_9ARAE
MATFFHGGPPEIPADGLQTLYLMNPGYVGYAAAAADAPAANMFLLNQAAVSPTQHQSPGHPQLVGIPLNAQVPAASYDHGRTPSSSSVAVHHDVSAVHGVPPRIHYNLWNAAPATNPGLDMATQQLRRPTQQGLSLSLSPQQPNYGAYRQEHEMQPRVVAPAGMPPGDDIRILVSPSSGSEGTNGMPATLQSVLMGSKYLRAAQQLLDEVVNVGKGIKDESPRSARALSRPNKEPEEASCEEACSKRAAELTTAERQELQMKKAKLVTMLDEVEQRYRQYHHQMQVVVSSFEAVAGFRSATTYTSLALQTISRQFRCLKDAITGQIRATTRSLGEEDCLAGGGKGEGGSRLRLVDHHLRQQRALQQLGMMQHNAWRPQRGLPERAVSVLRAWLFEHFLHPYPKDTDKLMLAKQTGLTRSQVSNWFINARVRLWKPMVEEMYLEEIKEHEQQNNSDDNNGKHDLKEDSGAPQDGSPTRTEQTDSLLTGQDDSGGDPKQPPHMIPTSDPAGIIRMQPAYSDSDSIVQGKLKKARSDESLRMNSMPQSMNLGVDFKPEPNNREFFTKFGDGRRGVEDHGFSFSTAGAAANHGGGFGAFSIGDIGRFDADQFAPRFSGNGVSLTLGLPHCESLSLSGAQPSFLSTESIPLGRRLDVGTDAGDFCSLRNNPSVAHPSNAFQNISNIQNRKGFAAALLPDFVA